MEYILQLYGLDCNDILVMSKSTWKAKSKKAVRDKAFSSLVIDSSNKSKTRKVSYSSFSRQGYLFQYSFKDACTIFKLRSRSVNCRGNQKSSSKSIICRLCKTCDETQQHIINCPAATDGPILDMSVIYEEDIQPNDKLIIEICSRVQTFQRKVNEIAVEESLKKWYCPVCGWFLSHIVTCPFFVLPNPHAHLCQVDIYSNTTGNISVPPPPQAGLS